MNATEQVRIFQCFKVGKHVTSGGAETHWNEGDLEKICQNFTAKEDVPLVLGHPQSNGPAYGFVRSLFLRAGILYAVAVCSAALIEMVRKGLYKNVSASFTQVNPAIGWSLRHIGFLGSCPPAVKGLAPLQFSQSYAAEPAPVCFSEFEEPSRARKRFNAPPGYRVNADALARFNRVREVQANCPDLSFAEAGSLAERYM